MDTDLPDDPVVRANKHRTDVVALLFTDIVGSTSLKHQLGDRAGVSLIQRHHAMLRECLAEFSAGKEVETAGDSFLIAFTIPSAAAAFALLLQARLREFSKGGGVPLQDRIGIHLGEVVVQEHAQGLKPRDLFGSQVDTCARVMNLAIGGQILLTRSAFDSARQMLKGEDVVGVGPIEWLNHGAYLLKGIEASLEVCEVGEVGIAPLQAPAGSEKTQRQVTPESEAVLGWRPAVGQLVPGSRWRLETKLGEGGFGEVWLGRHHHTKEQRVFKFCFQAERVRYLKREMTLFRLLKERVGDHPNIVRLHDVMLDHPPFYVEMDYVEGAELRSWSQEHGGAEAIPLATRLEIVSQAADGLQAAHEAGIIHRDIKPANILVGGKGLEPSEIRVKLTDFGIGQVVSEEYLAGVTRAGFTQTVMSDSSSSHAGTQIYMAPELLEGKPASTRSDIYSLGVVLYQLLVGDFSRPVTIDWADHVSDPLLRDDLKHCFAGNPQTRFDAAGQLAKNLRALPERRAAVQRQEAELERQKAELAAREKAAYRRGMIRTAGLAAVIVALVAGLAIVALYQSRKAKERLAESEAISKFLTEVFQSPDPARDGRTITVAETLGTASRKLDTELADHPAVRSKLQATLGDTYYALGLYREAIVLQEKVRDYSLATFGLENPDTLVAMLNLANSYFRAGRRDEALKLQEEMLRLSRKVNGPEDPFTLKAMHSMALSYYEVGRRDEALKLQEEVLRLSRKVNGPEHPFTLRAMHNLAMFYDHGGRGDEALRL
jgi:serine/threonine protein kinase/class 3 adenylate cyclase